MDAHLLPGRDRDLEEHRRLWGDPVHDVAGRAHEPREVLAAVTASGLRSRDGVGALTASRWSLLGGAESTATRYLVATAVDAEPASCRERAITWRNPFGVISGLVLSSTALGITDAFVVLPDDEPALYERFTDALAEAELAGWLDKVSVKTVRVRPDHLGVDGRAMVELVEGRAALPRRLATEVGGLFSGVTADSSEVAPSMERANPTLVDSVETFACVGPIVGRGAEWFRMSGTAVSPGHTVITVTGDVRVPAVAEIELGAPLRETLEEVGQGFAGTVSTVLSGVSSTVLTRSRLAAPLSGEGLAAVGANIGHGAFIVCCDVSATISLTTEAASFLADAACAQCPACTFGTAEIVAYLRRLDDATGDAADLNAIVARLGTIDDRRRCDLPSRFRDVVGSLLRADPSPGAPRSSAVVGAPSRPIARRVRRLSLGEVLPIG